MGPGRRRSRRAARSTSWCARASARPGRATSDRPADAAGVALTPLERDDRRRRDLRYDHVDVDIDRDARRRPDHRPRPAGTAARHGRRAGRRRRRGWLLAAARELDDAILHLRFNEPEVGTWVLRTDGRRRRGGRRRGGARPSDHWLAREIRLYWARTLKRLDVSARTLVALVEPGSCFAGTLAELALAADRIAHARRHLGGRPTAAADDASDRRQRRLVPDVQRPDPAARPASGAATTRSHAPGSWSARTCSPPRRSTPALVTFAARRHRLGRRGPAAARGARQLLARRAHRHGGQLPLRRPRDDGDEDLRPPVGVAELDLPTPQRRRARRRAAHASAPGRARPTTDARVDDRR